MAPKQAPTAPVAAPVAAHATSPPAAPSAAQAAAPGAAPSTAPAAVAAPVAAHAASPPAAPSAAQAAAPGAAPATAPAAAPRDKIGARKSATDAEAPKRRISGKRTWQSAADLVRERVLAGALHLECSDDRLVLLEPKDQRMHIPVTKHVAMSQLLCRQRQTFHCHPVVKGPPLSYNIKHYKWGRPTQGRATTRMHLHFSMFCIFT